MNLKHIMLSGREETQKVTYFMVLFVWNVQYRQMHREKKEINGCQTWEKAVKSD